MNQDAVTMVANGFRTGFPHPGDDQTPPHLIPMPGFRDTGMSPEQSEEFIGAAATLAAEGIVNLIESRYELIDKEEARQMRLAVADAPDGYRTIHIHPDARYKDAVLVFTIGNDDHTVIPAVALKAALNNVDAAIAGKS